MPLLEVEDLHVTFASPDGPVQAVRGVSFSVEPGDSLSLVGESGAGKSAAVLAMLGLSRGAQVTGQARFEGTDLLTLGERGRRALLGKAIGVVFQDPSSSLHPLYRVGWQIAEAIRAHERVGRSAARRRAIELLDEVGIPAPAARAEAYPHELSGGMRQRALIAMAVALRPRLLIADEPTTALDVTVQAQILDLLDRLRSELEMALVLITHDLGVVAESADRVLVVYAGRAVETAPTRTLFAEAHHPYTKGLLRSLPGEGGTARGAAVPIAGQPPSLLALPSGCPFHPRCPEAFDRCPLEEPPLDPVSGAGDHRSACWLPHRVLAER